MPRERRNPKSYPAVMPVNHRNNKYGKVPLKVKNGHSYLVVTKNHPFGLSRREILPGNQKT